MQYTILYQILLCIYYTTNHLEARICTSYNMQYQLLLLYNAQHLLYEFRGEIRLEYTCGCWRHLGMFKF